MLGHAQLIPWIADRPIANLGPMELKNCIFSGLEIGPLFDMASFMQESNVLLYSFQNTRSKYASLIFITRVALAKQGDYALGSVRPSVYLSVCVHSPV